MAKFSKLLTEYIVTAGVNDRFKVTDSGAVTLTTTITPGRYRDFTEFGEQFSIDLNAESTTNGTGDTFTFSVNNSTGITTISSDNTLTLWDFDTTNFGPTLMNDMGFSLDNPIISANSVTSTNTHVGGFYPSEPIEQDSRPDEDGSDTWTADTFHTQSRTGLVSTRGGTNLIRNRTIVVLLPQADLPAFETWMQRVAQGYSFAFYHDRDEAWDGPDDEYSEYKVFVSQEDGIEYFPEPVEAENRVWHRATLDLTKRVEPST